MRYVIFMLVFCVGVFAEHDVQEHTRQDDGSAVVDKAKIEELIQKRKQEIDELFRQVEEDLNDRKKPTRRMQAAVENVRLSLEQREALSRALEKSGPNASELQVENMIKLWFTLFGKRPMKESATELKARMRILKSFRDNIDAEILSLREQLFVKELEEEGERRMPRVRPPTQTDPESILEEPNFVPEAPIEAPKPPTLHRGVDGSKRAS